MARDDRSVLVPCQQQDLHGIQPSPVPTCIHACEHPIFGRTHAIDTSHTILDYCVPACQFQRVWRLLLVERDPNSIGTNNYSLNVRLKQYRLGHGYGANNLTVSMSLFILTLYSAVALTHFIYLAWTGFHSSTWDSVSKVVALAVNSQSAYELHKTCAGIRQTQVCANPVRITVTTENYDDHVLEVDPSKVQDYRTAFGARLSVWRRPCCVQYQDQWHLRSNESESGVKQTEQSTSTVIRDSCSRWTYMSKAGSLHQQSCISLDVKCVSHLPRLEDLWELLHQWRADLRVQSRSKGCLSRCNHMHTMLS